MISAWALCCKLSSPATNVSNSSSVSDPISLQGSRCSASSMTPPFTSQETACPLNLLIDSSAGVLAGCLAGVLARRPKAPIIPLASLGTFLQSHWQIESQWRLASASHSLSPTHSQLKISRDSHKTHAPACNVAILNSLD